MSNEPPSPAPRVDSGLFRLLVASVRDYAIFMLDVGGYVATWNPGAERLKGYRADEIIGQHFSVFYPGADITAGKCEIELAGAARDGSFEDEGWRVRKDGSRFWANVVITAMRDEAGALVGFAKVTRDLTERKRSEDERAARVAAEHANRTKDEFLALLGHELRNPLAPIVTALEVIRLRGDHQAEREHAVIERQVHSMARLVDDLLDVSRVARGKLTLRRLRLDIRDVLLRAIEVANPLIDAKAQQLEASAPAMPLLVDGDEQRLVQVFANILTNAAKYTPPKGRIWLRVRYVQGEIVVEIEDNGDGMAPDLVPRVFEPFVQGPQDPERSTGGLGLGLGLVKSLVANHGGQVSARSPGLGRGSTFTVRLPALQPPRGDSSREGPLTQTSAIAGAGAARFRIAIVDDNEDARQLLADVLRSLGHDVETACDGRAGLSLVQEQKPDLAILDIGLPGLSGYELAAQLRAAQDTQGVRLIALSGYGLEHDRERSRRAGFDAHLIKPVTVKRLIETIAEVA